MGLRILKAGILDTIQDQGRNGYQHWGINPTGAMDRHAAAQANLLVGNSLNQAVLEFHFPGPILLFETSAMIALTGADFGASVSGEDMPLYHPVLINKNTVLQFQSNRSRSRCYLAIKGGIKISKWLESCSTNLKAEAGGFNGRKLEKGDEISLLSEYNFSEITGNSDYKILPWKIDEEFDTSFSDELHVLPGSEWDWLDDQSQNVFTSNEFIITPGSDRMGYRLSGKSLQLKEQKELVSSAVSFGTIQLLPDGQLIILGADHQTTGGYPRIGNVISAYHSKLAQLSPGNRIDFKITDQQTAERLIIKQQRHLLQLEIACKLKLESFIHENN